MSHPVTWLFDKDECQHNTHTNTAEQGDEPRYVCDNCGSVAWS